MLIENLNIVEINEERRRAVAESIKLIGLQETKRLDEELFPYPDDPWRDMLFAFLSDNAGESFYHAAAQDDDADRRSLAHQRNA